MTNFELSALFMQLHARRRHSISNLLKDEDLHMGQLPILINVIKLSGSTQQEIARILDVSPASIATSCKRMEQAGLLERRVDAKNRRRNMLYATPRGLEIASRSKLMFELVDSRMYDVLDESERNTLIGILNKMICSIDDGYTPIDPFACPGGGEEMNEEKK